MKFNLWTVALAAAGVVSLGSLAQAEEAKNMVLTAVSSTTLSGYVDTSAIWQIGNQRQGNRLPGRSYDGTGKQDGFNLNVVKLSLSKPLDEGQWSAGYQVDLLFGPDAATFETLQGAVANDMAIQQAYVNLHAPVIGNGVDLIMGVYGQEAFQFGYESFDSYKNVNYSRSYGYFIQPHQFTGVLASYQAAEWLKLNAGIANTYNGGVNVRATRAGGVTVSETEKTYLASAVLTAPESFGFLKGSSLYAGIVDGLGDPGRLVGGAAANPMSDTTSFYAGLWVPTPVEGLGVGASYDYRGNKQHNSLWVVGPTTRSSSSYANALAGYITYRTEKWQFSNRAEYATSTDGLYYLSSSANNLHNQLFADTFTVSYDLWQNVTTRAEVRWDHDLTGQDTFIPGWTNGAPFGDRDRNALSLALNVIYKF